jgi:hypothetical protein
VYRWACMNCMSGFHRPPRIWPGVNPTVPYSSAPHPPVGQILREKGGGAGQRKWRARPHPPTHLNGVRPAARGAASTHALIELPRDRAKAVARAARGDV